MLKKISWWKYLTMLLLLYTLLAGLLVDVPNMKTGNLYQTARALYFHVPMWFGMSILLLISVVNAIRHLRTFNKVYDYYAEASAQVAMWFGVLGLVTGAIWAKFTWGAAWHGDPKQNAAAIAMLVYLAYFVLRSALEDPEKASRISAIYNVFAFAVYIPLIYILPRLTDSIHPGNGGNPGFNSYDLDGNMRKIFYPAVIGWTLLGWWFSTLLVRLKKIKAKQENIQYTKTIEVASKPQIQDTL
ncbi:MAG: cytochrome c biogenesis protein CcsA [Thermonemataceae bacterium]